MAPVKFKCASRDNVFNSKSSFGVHTQIHKSTHQCVFYNRTFASVTQLFIHFRYHINENPHFCELCGSTCTSISSLKSHIKSLTCEKCFSCHICKKLYVMTTHKLINSGIRKFKCCHCDKIFV